MVKPNRVHGSASVSLRKDSKENTIHRNKKSGEEYFSGVLGDKRKIRSGGGGTRWAKDGRSLKGSLLGEKRTWHVENFFFYSLKAVVLWSP